MAVKRASEKTNSDHVFGRAWKPGEVFRSLLRSCFTDDQHTLMMLNRQMSEHACIPG
jgi:hypothetical protein